MYKFFLIFRYLRKRRIAYFAILAVALCVAMVLVVHSVMGGFLDTVRNSSRRLLGDVILEIGSMETFPYYDEFIAELNEKMGDEIVAAAPVIINVALLRVFGGLERDRNDYCMINGIRLDEYRKINSFGDGLYYDKHFPGTTTLEEQAMPMWRVDERGLPRLPADYERAYADYQKETDDPDVEAKYKRQPFQPYPGPGVFKWAEGLGYDESDSDLLPGIIIGVDMVAWREKDGSYTRKYDKGARVRVQVPSLTRSGAFKKTEPFIQGFFRYVDDSRTKIFDIDSKNIYVDFDLLQRLMQIDAQEYTDGSGLSAPRATQIQVKLHEGVDYNQARDTIRTLWDDFGARYAVFCPDPMDAYSLIRGMQVQTWEERNAGFINAVKKERILVDILFSLISLVAVLLVGCIFYMIVQEKTREIGIIRSMGATSGGVWVIFVSYALVIGIVGSAMGTVVGVLFVRYINEFQDFIAEKIHPELLVWSPENYAFDKIPNIVKPFDAAVIAGIAVFSCVLGSLVAARKAAKIWPVDAIRYE